MKWLLLCVSPSRNGRHDNLPGLPKTPLTFYVFAAVLGFTWLATRPPDWSASYSVPATSLRLPIF